MVPSKIRELAMTSTKIYLDWLKEKGKGAERINTNSIRKNDDTSYTFTLNKKPYSVESLCLCIDNKYYFSDTFAVSFYDEKKLQLQIRWLKEDSPLCSMSSAMVCKRVSFVSDMKFLVENVYEWYSTHGTELSIPSIASVCKNKAHEFLEEYNTISDEQKKAILTSLTSPFSYIWGAPGTGKTRYVLAHSMLFHIIQNNRVLLLAPTNNSLDQSLRGILEVLQENDISLENIFRLGVPTSTFYQEYPECCEDKHRQKITLELREELEKNQRKKAQTRLLNNVQFCCDTMSLVYSCAQQYLDLQQQIEYCSDNLRTKKVLLDHAEQLIKTGMKQIDDINAYARTLRYKLKSKLNSRYSSRLRDENERLIQDISVADKDRESLTIAISELETKEKLLMKQSSELNLFERMESVDKLLHNILNCSMRNWQTVNDYLDECPDLLSELQTLKNSLIEKGAGDKNQNDLAKEEARIEQQLQSLSIGLNQRLLKTKVLAMTLDAYISRYDTLGDDKDFTFEFNPEQIFLDEAGYCSLIKGITILRNNIPVTLLGDHMQLPPVCEMSRNDIIENHPRVFMWDQSLLYAEELFQESNVKCFESYRNLEAPPFVHLTKSDLTSTFRFGNRLSRILDSFVYKNGFHSSGNTEDFLLEIVNVNKRKTEINTHVNTEEAEWIVAWIASTSDEKSDDFVVLTPYRKQVEVIKRLVRNPEDKNKIMTIHSSQGKEWSTVVLSVVDTQDKFFVDIHNPETKALELINTAVSRTKKRLIIVCDVDYWKTQEDQFIYGLISNQKRGGFYES